MEYQEHKVTGVLSFLVDGTRSKLVGKNIMPGKRILDIGCGNGLLIPFLPESVSYVGVDINQEVLDWLKKKYPRLTFSVCEAGKNPLPSGPFDIVTLAGFIEHIEPALYFPLLKNIKEVLSEDGLIILTTPTVFGGHLHRWLSKIGLVSKEAAEEHKNFLSKTDLFALFQKTGFKIVEHRYYFLGCAHYVSAKVRD